MGGRKERNKKAAIRRALEKERRKLLPVKREEDGEEVFVVFSFNAPLGSLGGLELCHLFFLLLWGLT